MPKEKKPFFCLLKLQKKTYVQQTGFFLFFLTWYHPTSSPEALSTMTLPACGESSAATSAPSFLHRPTTLGLASASQSRDTVIPSLTGRPNAGVRLQGKRKWDPYQ